MKNFKHTFFTFMYIFYLSFDLFFYYTFTLSYIFRISNSGHFDIFHLYMWQFVRGFVLTTFMDLLLKYIKTPPYYWKYILNNVYIVSKRSLLKNIFEL